MMQFVVRLPDSHRAERSYAVRSVLEDLLGQEAHVVFEPRSDCRIEGPDAGARAVVMPDSFFAERSNTWLTPHSLPTAPLARFPATDLSDRVRRLLGGARELPLLAHAWRGAGHALSDKAGQAVHCALDVFGCAFFMLSRYEEACSSTADSHGRFPSSASLAIREGFLQRPLVNEYGEVLWDAILSLWPGVERRTSGYARHLSHDVDRLRSVHGLPVTRLARNVLGDVTKRRSLTRAARRARAWFRARQHPERDPWWNFDDVMDTAEAGGVRSVFHFLVGRSGAYDADYFPTDPDVVAAIGKIAKRGHAIGVHGSYHTATDARKLGSEVAALRALCARHGSRLDHIASRQHYLRWSARLSPGVLDACGIHTDSTLGFSDAVGFRTGACFQHRLFDFERGCPTAVRELPLHVMDTALLHHTSVDPPWQDAADSIVQIREAVRRHRGTFVVLLHQDTLVEDPRGREFLRTALR